MTKNNKQRRPKNRSTQEKQILGKAKPANGLTSGSGGLNTVMVERWMPVFAPSVTAVLRYADVFGMATTSGTVTSTQVFRANDLYDPDFSSTGHQPMGFDQLMLWYNHFTVRRARLICNFKNTGSTNPTVCIRVDGDSTALTSTSRILELGNCVSEILEYKGVQGSTKQLELSVDIAKLQGVSQKTITADANLRGSAAASPVEVSYFHVTMWDSNAATGSGTCDFILEQEATFYEPRDLSTSLRDSREELKLPGPSRFPPRIVVPRK